MRREKATMSIRSVSNGFVLTLGDAHMTGREQVCRTMDEMIDAVWRWFEMPPVGAKCPYRRIEGVDSGE